MIRICMHFSCFIIFYIVKGSIIFKQLLRSSAIPTAMISSMANEAFLYLMISYATSFWISKNFLEVELFGSKNFLLWKYSYTCPNGYDYFVSILLRHALKFVVNSTLRLMEFWCTYFLYLSTFRTHPVRELDADSLFLWVKKTTAEEFLHCIKLQWESYIIVFRKVEHSLS